MQAEASQRNTELKCTGTRFADPEHLVECNHLPNAIIAPAMLLNSHWVAIRAKRECRDDAIELVFFKGKRSGISHDALYLDPGGGFAVSEWRQ